LPNSSAVSLPLGSEPGLASSGRSPRPRGVAGIAPLETAETVGTAAVAAVGVEIVAAGNCH